MPTTPDALKLAAEIEGGALIRRIPELEADLQTALGRAGYNPPAADDRS